MNEVQFLLAKPGKGKALGDKNYKFKHNFLPKCFTYISIKHQQNQGLKT